MKAEMLKLDVFDKKILHELDKFSNKTKFSDVIDYMEHFSYSSIIRINYVPD